MNTELQIAQRNANFQEWVDSLDNDPTIADATALVKIARDQVYAQRGRGTMYLDVIQDMVDWLTSSYIMARARLGDWYRNEFGYVMPVTIEIGYSTFTVRVVALGDWRNHGYTVVVAEEYNNLMRAIARIDG